jgi:hypothetical protein
MRPAGVRPSIRTLAPLRRCRKNKEIDMTGSTSADRSAVTQTQTVRDEVLPAQAQSGPTQALQLWMGYWLLTAQNSAGWVQEVQRQGLQATTHWVETLALGALLARQAQSIGDLMDVPKQVFSHQLDEGFKRTADNLTYLLADDASWLDPWRSHPLAALRALATTFPD